MYTERPQVNSCWTISRRPLATEDRHLPNIKTKKITKVCQPAEMIFIHMKRTKLLPGTLLWAPEEGRPSPTRNAWKEMVGSTFTVWSRWHGTGGNKIHLLPGLHAGPQAILLVNPDPSTSTASFPTDTSIPRSAGSSRELRCVWHLWHLSHRWHSLNGSLYILVCRRAIWREAFCYLLWKNYRRWQQSPVVSFWILRDEKMHFILVNLQLLQQQLWGFSPIFERCCLPVSWCWLKASNNQVILKRSGGGRVKPFLSTLVIATAWVLEINTRQSWDGRWKLLTQQVI